MTAATWAPRDEAERAAMVDMCEGAIRAWTSNGRHGDGPRSVSERYVPPVPSRTREYPRVVRYETAEGFQFVVTFERGCFMVASAGSQMYASGASIAEFTRYRQNVTDDTIAELLALKANPTETVTLPEDVTLVVGHVVSSLSLREPAGFFWNPPHSSRSSALEYASEKGGRVHELLLGAEVTS